MKPFKSPRQFLGDLSADIAAELLVAAADIAFVVDAKGVIRDIAIGSDALADAGCADWVGKLWLQTATAESRGKVEALLADAIQGQEPRWRHVNQMAGSGAQVPILFAAVALGARGRVVAIGRDLRAMALLQQRLVDAQQSMERDYAQLRDAEMRYRLVFHTAAEPMLVVDATTFKVVEANPAAASLQAGAREIAGTGFLDLLDAPSASAARGALTAARNAGRLAELNVRTADARRQYRLSGSAFRQDNAALVLVRFAPAEAALAAARPHTALLQIMEGLPDALVVTDPAGRIVSANAAFLDLVQLPAEERARGEPLGRWVGRADVDIGLLLANVEQHGAVRLFTTTLRGELGLNAEVEISGVAVPDSGAPRYGFTMRNIGRRLANETRDAREGRGELPRSAGQVTELIGRMPLREIVRQTADVIERLCIEAALEITGDNRASAAEMLGLSRQSLYVKLRRYGLGDLQPGEDA